MCYIITDVCYVEDKDEMIVYWLKENINIQRTSYRESSFGHSLKFVRLIRLWKYLETSDWQRLEICEFLLGGGGTRFYFIFLLVLYTLTFLIV